MRHAYSAGGANSDALKRLCPDTCIEGAKIYQRQVEEKGVETQKSRTILMITLSYLNQQLTMKMQQ